jgi:hypothetical protein
MWAAKVSASGINWVDAERYCKNYRGGGYTDWRLPTQDELAGLYDDGYNMTNLISLTNAWASETRGSEAATFSFLGGSRNWSPQSHSRYHEALPVRSVK